MLKNSVFALSILVLAASCSSLKPAASKSSAGTAATQQSSIEFIDNIAIRPASHKDKTGGSIPTAGLFSGQTEASHSRTGALENYSALQFKFAILEDAMVEDLNNLKLLSFMDYWYGTRYRYGGNTRDGIDCSAFAYLLISSVYNMSELPRMAKDQYVASRRIRRDELQEGDLVFFHTLGKRKAVTHVGVYLRNNKFVHASVSGVMISDMNDGYYDKHYIGAGRVLPQS
ncbi:MAG: NlpC/P60 family protein [Puia sp.]|nr:NlpC/P60 family protein [Puia sp.]